MPAADQIVFNRYYVLGYSYYFRQAKWALEIVDPDNPGLDRLDNFRPDYRIPEMFRADLVEKLAGIKLWERLVGKKIDREKSKVRKMW